MTPQKQSWSPNQICAEMKARRITQADIAREAGVSEVAVHYCIHRTHKTYVGRRIRVIIAQRLGVPVEVIWPDMAQQSA